jgi:hypothetical protein
MLLTLFIYYCYFVCRTSYEVDWRTDEGREKPLDAESVKQKEKQAL